MKDKIERTDSILIIEKDCIYKAFTDKKITREVLEGVMRLDRLVNNPPIIDRIEATNEIFASSQHDYLSPVILMRNLGHKNSLSELTYAENIRQDTFEHLAKFLLNSYSKMKTTTKIDKTHILKRFQKDIKLIESYMSLDPSIKLSFDYLINKIDAMQNILLKRASKGFVQEIHGDLNLDHVFYVNNEFYLIDFSSLEKYRIDDISRDISGIVLHLLELDKDNYIGPFLNSFQDQLNDENLVNMVNIQLVKKNLLKYFIYQGGFSENHIDKEKSDFSIAMSKKINKLIL